ncbi:MAG TPA: DUF3467 domain-containing protein [Candidatus Dormibacteraeota bacterium]|nr:DUF3467 domain-containing protein [Candidatus Dormibacteraeota bacterium]
MSQADQPPADVPAPSPVQVQIPEQHSEIAYSDQAFVYFTPVGFTIDFAQLTPQIGMSRVVSRVGMSATHLKLLVQVLTDNLHHFESQFGVVQVTPQMVEQHVPQRLGIGFHPGPAEAPPASSAAEQSAAG